MCLINQETREVLAEDFEITLSQLGCSLSNLVC